MKKIYFLLIVVLICKLGNAQIIYQENFQGGTMPATFTLYNDTLIPNDASFLSKAWTVQNNIDPFDANNFVAATTSWFTNASIKADRWMITPAITISSATSNKLGWRSVNIDANAKDTLIVLISKTGILKANFTDTLYIGADTTSWANHILALSNYIGQSIHIAFVDQSTDKYILLVDDIVVGTGVGINTVAINNIIGVYPNPAKDFITINSNNLIKEIKIYNTLGQIVFSEKNNNKATTLNVSNLTVGLYTVSIETEKGISVKKLCLTK